GGNLMVYSKRSGSVKISYTRSSTSGLVIVGGTVGPSRTMPLRVVMALSSPFELATVLLGRDPDPEVEAVFIRGNLLERRTQDVLTIIENKSKSINNECCDYRHDGYSQTISSNPTSSFRESR
nr:hypothetical protein [Tanacetum cinerariifolium]